VPGVELRKGFSSRVGLALNGVFGIAAETFNAVAELMLLPGLILAFFVAELTPSYTTIGLVPAISLSFWTLARLPAHILTAERRRKRPWVFAAALIRAAAIAVLAIVTSRADPAGLSQSARPLLGTFFLCLIVFSLAGGFGSVPGAALLRAAVPAGAWSTFLRRRSTAVALVSVLGAVVLARVFGTDAWAFPSNYGRLFLLATVCLIAAAVFTAALREPASSPATLSSPLLSPRALRQPLFDSRYRRFLFFRVLLSATAAIDPFLFLYAVTRMGVPLTAIAQYVLAGTLGWVVSAPAWLWVERRSGPRSVLQAAAVLRLTAPAVALTLPPLATTDALRTRLADGSPITTAYGLAFFAIGAALAAQARGNHDYLSALAPRPLLAAYTGLTNVILAVVAFSPVVGGMVIQRFGYEALFVVAAALGLVAVFAGGLLAFTPARVGARAGRDQDLVTRRQALSAGRL
jgi:hypothetical protein